MKIVLDTNVIVSAALLPGSTSNKAWSKAKLTGTIICSETVFIELVDTLFRPKFDRYIPKQFRSEFIGEFARRCEFIEVIDTVEICRDPSDNKYLELALSGKADCLVTGDKDFLH